MQDQESDAGGGGARREPAPGADGPQGGAPQGGSEGGRPWPARVTPEGLPSARAAAMAHARAATAARGGVIMGQGGAAQGSRTVQAEPAPALPPELQALGDRVVSVLPALEREAGTVGLPAFRARREALLDVASALSTLAETPLDYLSCLCGVDHPDRVDVVYHLFSIRGRVGLVLKVGAPKPAAGAPEGVVPPEQNLADLPWLPSVTGVWPGADWHEREVYDLLGVRFADHPDLRRILMPEGFSGGYPLRKDYVDRREQRARKVRDR